MNVLYVGKDSSGFHFSLKDQMSLNLEAGGEVIIKGAQGIYRNTEEFYIYNRRDSGFDYLVYHS